MAPAASKNAAAAPAPTPIPFAQSQAAAVALIQGSTSNPPADLAEERQRATFPVADLTNHLLGAETAARRKFLEDLVSSYAFPRPVRAALAAPS